MNHENGDRIEAQADARRKRRRKERIVHSSVASFASVELTSQTSKCEQVLTEAQAETEGRAVLVSASIASVNQAYGNSNLDKTHSL